MLDIFQRLCRRRRQETITEGALLYLQSLRGEAWDATEISTWTGWAEPRDISRVKGRALKTEAMKARAGSDGDWYFDEEEDEEQHACEAEDETPRELESAADVEEASSADNDARKNM